MRIYDFALLVATIVDASQVKKKAVEVTRPEIQRFSVGRDNPIQLKIKSGKHKAIARLRDAFPQEFTVDTDTLEVDLPPNSTEELQYIIQLNSRGEYEWGDIQVRQLGKLGLAWRDWTIPARQTQRSYSVSNCSFSYG